MLRSPYPARHALAHSYAATVGGGCLLLAIGLIIAILLWPRDAAGVPIELPPNMPPPAWQPPCAKVPCIVGDYVVAPKAMILHDVEVGQKLIKRVQELEDQVERLRQRLRALQA